MSMMITPLSYPSQLPLRPNSPGWPRDKRSGITVHGYFESHHSLLYMMKFMHYRIDFGARSWNPDDLYVMSL